MAYMDAVLPSCGWLDLDCAAAIFGLTRREIVEAVTNHNIRATTAYPGHPGEWMVPMGDVELWIRQRNLLRAVSTPAMVC